MVNSVRLAKYETNFRAEQPDKNKAEAETRILPNTMHTRIKQNYQKTSNAFTYYPIKGLKGDINSNFYEFLSMGIVPYLAGSAMFMVAFNCLKNSLSPRNQIIGKKFALGVILYGVMKSLSKNLVTKPVKITTGIDTEMPYENVVYPLPKEAGEDANIDIQYQQRKVFDSKEFYRKDLLDRAYFDKVAEKLGLGKNLNDSITETSPIIQNVVATTNTAKSLSSYCWAAVGVCLAAQDAWVPFFNSFTNKKKFVKQPDLGFMHNLKGKTKNLCQNTWNITKEFCHSFGKSIKEMWLGQPGTSGYRKHAGKAVLSITTLLTTFLTLNTIIRAKNLAKNNNKQTIDQSKESTVI